MNNNMKKFFKAAGKIKNKQHEIVIPFLMEQPFSVFEKTKQAFKDITIKVCEHTAPTGKTVLLILKDGLVEIHEIILKDCTYIKFTTSNKKIFEKYKTCLD